jgi:hypothetical protein
MFGKQFDFDTPSFFSQKPISKLIAQINISITDVGFQISSNEGFFLGSNASN